MKKITYLILLFFTCLSYGQMCEQVFEVEGDDDTPMVLTVNASDLDCAVGTVNSITITDAILDNYFSYIFGETYCGEYYSFELDIDGVTSLVCAEDLIGMVITDFTTFTITSADIDDWPDSVYMGVLIEVNFSATEAPECVTITEPITDSENALNGLLEWDPVAGAIGYRISLGTTPGGTDVLESFDAEDATSYNVPGLLTGGAEYFLTVTAYNNIGDATGCEEYSFTVPIPPTGSTCQDPLLVDALPFNTTGDTSDYFDTLYEGSPGASGCGSTNSYLNGNDVVYSYTSTFTGTVKILLTPAANSSYGGFFVYGSCSEIGASCLGGAVNSSTPAPMMIEEFPVETGMTYYIVVSTWAAPQTLAYTLDITQNTCSNGAATYTVVSDCENGDEQFMVEVNVTDLGSATSVTVSDNQGSAPQSVSVTGIVTFGPYPNNNPVIFTVVNDQDDSCTLTSPTMNQLVCPPANDNCSGAEELIVNTSYVCDSVVTTTLNGATGSVVAGNTCFGNANDDIWYSFVATATSHRISLLAVTPYVDLYHSLWTGDCEGTLTLVTNSCSDSDVSNPSGLVPGQVYYLRIYSYGAANSTSTFNVCIGTPPPPPANDTCETAIDLTNETSPLQSSTEGATNTNLFVCNNDGVEVANTWGDVYYSILVPDGSTLSIGQTENGYDSANVVFYGDCDNRTSIACFDDDDDDVVEWANNTGEDQTVYWVQDGWSATGTFTLAWSVIACTPAEATYTVISDCENGDEQFMVEVNVTDLGSATSVTVSDDQDSTPQSVSVTGIVTFGPYPNDNPVIFTVVNDQDDNCTLTSSELNQVACPPSNDDCAGAILIVVDEQFCDGVNNNGTNLGATDSGIDAAECFDYGQNDVWFSFVVPEGTATVDISTDFLGGTLLDTEIALYSGSCDALVEEDCDQDGGTVTLSNGFSWNSKITDVEVTVGETYFVRVSGYSSENIGNFCLDISTNQTLSASEFESNNFKVYPNPVKDILNLSYTQNITSVEVFNMLGQQVATKAVNATQGQVDMSSLATGTYLVKVATDGQVKTLKVIKQ